jgi:hypothetical protein
MSGPFPIWSVGQFASNSPGHGPRPSLQQGRRKPSRVISSGCAGRSCDIFPTSELASEIHLHDKATVSADMPLAARRAALAILTGAINAARCAVGAASISPINTRARPDEKPNADRRQRFALRSKESPDPINSDYVIDEQTSVSAIGYFRIHLGYTTPPPSAELILTLKAPKGAIPTPALSAPSRKRSLP